MRNEEEAPGSFGPLAGATGSETAYRFGWDGQALAVTRRYLSAWWASRIDCTLRRLVASLCVTKSNMGLVKNPKQGFLEFANGVHRPMKFLWETGKSPSVLGRYGAEQHLVFPCKAVN